MLSKQEARGQLGLIANKRIAGVFKNIDRAALVLCLLSDRLRKPGSEKILDYYGYVIRNDDDKVIGISTLEQEPDPRLSDDYGKPRGRIPELAEMTMYMLPQNMRGGDMPATSVEVGQVVMSKARDLGFEKLEAVVSLDNGPSRWHFRELGFVQTSQTKEAPKPLGTRILFKATL